MKFVCGSAPKLLKDWASKQADNDESDAMFHELEGIEVELICTKMNN